MTGERASGFEGLPESRPGVDPETIFLWRVRVYYEDTDAGGVVYYANYLKFMERARSEWLRALGVEQDALAAREGVLFVVHRANVEFRAPARFNDLLRVESRISHLGRVRITFEQRIFADSNPTSLLCAGDIEVASVKAESFRPVAIPRTVISELSSEC